MDPNTRALIMGAAGAGGAAEKLYVEDVFSTWLYTGNGSTQTITNGIDLSSKGGLVWIKNRAGTHGAEAHCLFDSLRGSANNGSSLATNNSSGELTGRGAWEGFTSSGFEFDAATSDFNWNGDSYASWTFRKAAKFFDVVTYTGNGSNRTIAHNLGSVPGCIIVKRTDASADWQVYHRSLANTDYMVLNSTAASATGTTRWNSTTPTSSVFSLGTDSTVNANGGSYVAYLFAHDAGGFGDSGADNVVSCGSYTGNGSATGPTVTLGWEPQWLLIKRTDTTGDWNLIDNMRGFVVGGADAELNPNLTAVESSGTFVTPLSNGFQLNTTDAGYNASNGTYVYIAIRRGPMKTPTDATKVYENVAYTGDQTSERLIGTSALVDFFLLSDRDATSTSWTSYAHYIFDRLRGRTVSLATALTNTESTGWGGYVDFDRQTGWDTSSSGGGGYLNKTSTKYVSHNFRRAPGFFDVVCYTGTGVARTVSHNLGVAPELMIVKQRNSTTAWAVYSVSIGNANWLRLNTTDASGSAPGMWNSTSPTSSVFSVGTSAASNDPSGTFIAYLFASCPGVSKVGSYTGTGTTLDVDCGFTNGARFVLIKRTDSTGDWYVWDTARGIVSGNDPYLLLNSTAAEVTNTDYIDPLSSGFQISSTAPAAINANGGSFIYLAIA